MVAIDVTPRAVVTRFWEAMGTNDFAAAAQWLHDDFVLDWPQSGERVRGRDNFAALNTHYPAAGRWVFTLTRLITEGDQVVTDVSVTDGAVQARAVTFSTVRGGKIWRQVEYWPDPFVAAEWRTPWVERA
jgi:ketosteroid isomerase-like protein